MDDNSQKILSIDIGGSKIKGTVLNEDGEFIREYHKIATPSPSTPGKVMDVIRELAANYPDYDKVSVGFPGFIKNGVVKTAPNLGTSEWADFNLQKNLEMLLGKPTIAINDADLQAMAVVSGTGLEMVVTLGTGFGTALVYNGNLLPHLEIAHHPVTKKKDYDQYIGEEELLRIGLKKWNKRMERVLDIIKTVINYDTLYLSGGNADKLTFPLDKNILIVNNRDGIKGGAGLWRQPSVSAAVTGTFSIPGNN